MMNASIETFIRCDGIWKIYNPGRPHEVQALRDVSLTLERGSFTVFHGPSGSGKTSLIGLLGAMDRPSRGSIYLDGKDTTRLTDLALSRLRRKRIGFVFQNFNLIPELAAWENIVTPLIPQGIRKRERRERAMSLLDKLDLSGRADHTPEEMSGGEQQRVAIARALVNDPDILILDEPTSNIDAETASLVLDLLQDFKTRGKTVIVSSHEQDMVGSADRVLELSKGALVDIKRV